MKVNASSHLNFKFFFGIENLIARGKWEKVLSHAKCDTFLCTSAEIHANYKSRSSFISGK